MIHIVLKIAESLALCWVGWAFLVFAISTIDHIYRRLRGQIDGPLDDEFLGPVDQAQ